MKTRAITGFFFVIVMLAALLTGPRLFTLFFLILSLLCLNEFYTLISGEGLKPQRILGLLLGFIVFGAACLRYFHGITWDFALIAVPVTVLIFISELYRKSSVPFQNIAFTFLGVILTIIPFTLFYATAFLEGLYNFHFPLGFFLMLWANDTGAYLFGVKFGKLRLFERHSPLKSWEGFAGGLATSILVSFILSYYFTELPALHWAVSACIISIFGTFGDLTESMLKRSLDKKDSGSLLPGHGGLLDRFDGLFLSAPLVYVYLYFVLS